jgi:PiT family inorganic phosphate transporter
LEVSLVAALLVAVAVAFAFSIGAHYTGACMGMPYAAGAIRLGPALLLMAPIAFIGAFLASGSVEGTVGHGILVTGSVALGVALLIVTSALVLTSAYNFLTIPTSTIQILVFSTIGVGFAAGISINWSTIEILLVIWASAPVAAFAIGYAGTRLADRWRPVASVASERSKAWMTGLVAIGLTASFAMGANDVSNASGPLVMTGLFGLLAAGFIGGVGIALGVLTWGRPLLRTVAFDIVKLDPRMALTSQIAQSLVILVSVAFGYFTSMNQALVAAMLGTGMARGQSAVLWKPVRGILIGWLIGPASGLSLGFALTWLSFRGGLM